MFDFNEKLSENILTMPNFVKKKKKVLGVTAYNSCRINGETMETMTDFIFLGSEIIAGSDCSHENKRCLLLGRKAMTNIDNILKGRDVTLLPKIYIVKAMVLQVVTYGCESWTIKKAECPRIDAFELWCWRRLDSPLDCKEMQPFNPKGNQS